MTKAEYLRELEKGLARLDVADAKEILSEYEQHFALKMADGYSEEEIAAKLGNPGELASQFTQNDPKRSTPPGVKALTIMGLCFADFGVGCFFLIFALWVLCLGAAALAFFALGLCLLLHVNPFQWLPPVPIASALLFAIALMALTVLTAVGTYYCALFVKQLWRAYGRWHQNMLSMADGKPVHPPLSAFPHLPVAIKRRLRAILLIALAVFACFTIVTYVVSAITAQSLEFWHVWQWFS